MKYFFISILSILLFTSCSVSQSNNYDSMVKTFSGSNNFETFVNHLVINSSKKLKQHLLKDDVVLVSDFVNLDKLKNRSKLGFLLSDYLKNALSNNNIIVRQVELRENFALNNSGFNLLTRDANKIQRSYVDVAKYAVVGTYTITTESLIVFIKLIDLNTGNILSSSSNRTALDDEIIDLESVKKENKREIVLPPHVVL
ncbi:MAG: FlgO family outer membrane protein [Halarcobacter sp.]